MNEPGSPKEPPRKPFNPDESGLFRLEELLGPEPDALRVPPTLPVGTAEGEQSTTGVSLSDPSLRRLVPDPDPDATPDTSASHSIRDGDSTRPVPLPSRRVVSPMELEGILDNARRVWRSRLRGVRRRQSVWRTLKATALVLLLVAACSSSYEVFVAPATPIVGAIIGIGGFLTVALTVVLGLQDRWRHVEIHAKRLQHAIKAFDDLLAQLRTATPEQVRAICEKAYLVGSLLDPGEYHW